MTEKSKSSQKPASDTPQKTPPTIVAKPGGEQPGTRAFVNKAETKKR